MSAVDGIARLKPLQAAVSALNAASDAISRVKAGAALVKVMRDLGLLDAPAAIGDNQEDDYSDNPNDDNYRYADTGYIAGSLKEEASSRIKDLAKDGLTVKATDIEWDEIESDPLLAEDVIKKANIIGDIDYQAMKDDGGDAGTAFIIQKVFASIAPQPHWDIYYFLKNSRSGKSLFYGLNMAERDRLITAIDSYSNDDQKKAARKAYVNGINTLKSRISNITDCKVLAGELKDIKAEMAGFKIDADDQADYDELQSELEALTKKIKADQKENLTEYADAVAQAKKDLGLSERSNVIFSNEENAFVEYPYLGSTDMRLNAIRDWLNRNRSDGVTFVNANRGNHYGIEVVAENDLQNYKAMKAELGEMTLNASIASLKDTGGALAWIALGERFWNVIEFTSSSFVKHINKAHNKKYDDWSLTIKDSASGAKKKGKKKTTFELIVADNIERIGGDPVTVKSTEELKSAFGFRDIQSGNWVLKDKASAKFHVENAAAAMMDLSDVVGIDAKYLAFDGRLALALGARGRSKALAHYEPVQRVINITKMKGGGSLGHEWFHAIDNILGEVLSVDGATGAGVFLSEDSSSLASHPLNGVFGDLRLAMLSGSTRAPEKFKITQKDIDLALLNIKPEHVGGIKALIRDNTAEDAVLAVDARLGSIFSSKRSRNHNAWRKIAVAYHNQDKADQVVVLKTGDKVSEYYANSLMLDAERSKPYWSTTLEMAARAFQAFLEDSLKDQDRRNDYLSYGADNDLYAGHHNAYPTGDERKEINKVFKQLFKTIKDEKVFEKAVADSAMMDSIFGVSACIDDEGLGLGL